MTIAANTQIGPDGNRFQPGVDWPIESQIGGAAEQLDVLEDSNIQWHRQPVADMLTGTGMKNGGSLLTGAGFIIPPSWDYVMVELIWAKLGTYSTPGPISLGARLTWYPVDESFGSPYFGGHSEGGVTIGADEVISGKTTVTTVVEADPVQGAILTIDYGRVSTLGATGTRATELEAADTATINAGQAGMFAVVISRPIPVATPSGHTWRKRGHTWRR